MRQSPSLNLKLCSKHRLGGSKPGDPVSADTPALGLQIYDTTAGLYVAVGNQTQVLGLVQQALYPLCHLPVLPLRSSGKWLEVVPRLTLLLSPTSHTGSLRWLLLPTDSPSQGQAHSIEVTRSHNFRSCFTLCNTGQPFPNLNSSSSKDISQIVCLGSRFCCQQH